MEVSVRYRITAKPCPLCAEVRLVATEIPAKHVDSYHCPACDEGFHAEVRHTGEELKPVWVARHKNPKYWEMQNETIAEGLEQMAAKERAGIPDYLGDYVIEDAG